MHIRQSRPRPPCSRRPPEKMFSQICGRAPPTDQAGRGCQSVPRGEGPGTCREHGGLTGAVGARIRDAGEPVHCPRTSQCETAAAPTGGRVPRSAAAPCSRTITQQAGTGQFFFWAGVARAHLTPATRDPQPVVLPPPLAPHRPGAAGVARAAAGAPDRKLCGLRRGQQAGGRSCHRPTPTRPAGRPRRQAYPAPPTARPTRSAGHCRRIVRSRESVAGRLPGSPRRCACSPGSWLESPPAPQACG